MDNNKLVLLAYCTDNLAELVSEAEKRGLAVEVLVTEDKVFDAIERYNAKYVVGVCCQDKINKAKPHLDGKGIIYKAIQTKDGDECFKKSGIKRGVSIYDYTSALDWLCEKCH